MAGVMLGRVMLRNFCQLLAPSTSALSYSDFGTPFSAARKISIPAPLDHIVIRISAGFDHNSLVIHSGTREVSGHEAVAVRNSAKWKVGLPASAAIVL